MKKKSEKFEKENEWIIRKLIQKKKKPNKINIFTEKKLDFQNY